MLSPADAASLDEWLHRQARLGALRDGMIVRWRSDPVLWTKMREYAFALLYGASTRKVRLAYMKDHPR